MLNNAGQCSQYTILSLVKLGLNNKSRPSKSQTAKIFGPQNITLNDLNSPRGVVTNSYVRLSATFPWALVLAVFSVWLINLTPFVIQGTLQPASLLFATIAYPLFRSSFSIKNIQHAWRRNCPFGLILALEMFAFVLLILLTRWLTQPFINNFVQSGAYNTAKTWVTSASTDTTIALIGFGWWISTIPLTATHIARHSQGRSPYAIACAMTIGPLAFLALCATNPSLVTSWLTQLTQKPFSYILPPTGLLIALYYLSTQNGVRATFLDSFLSHTATTKEHRIPWVSAKGFYLVLVGYFGLFLLSGISLLPAVGVFAAIGILSICLISSYGILRTWYL